MSEYMLIAIIRHVEMSNDRVKEYLADPAASIDS